ESYSKIISYGSNSYGPTSFKVWTKSGQIIEFGNTADSAIEAQGKTAIRVWAVNKVGDTKGNYLTVTYTEVNANGEYYPIRIDYTGNAAAVLTPYNSVRFTYAVRPDVIPATYVSGSLTSITKRLTNVQTYANVSGADTLVKDYQLTYANGSAPNNASRVTQIKECSGTAGDCLQPTALDWQLASGNGGLTLTSWPLPNASGRVAGVGDFNGDGYADVVYGVLVYVPPGDNGTGSYYFDYYVAYSNGNGYGTGIPLGISSHTMKLASLTIPPAVTGDINGDGKDDL
ncbi:MAG: VCBS repeat-containing protein, partial [Gallionella sp.]|nr:VCBS repeat-containing protein [Gallionella sp.]